MARQTKTLTECVSCGGEADPKSPRGFCTECDAVFEAGLERQAEIEARAERLEQAKADGDKKAEAKIMGEIFRQGAE